MSIASLEETRVQNEVLSTTAEALHPSIVENALDGHPGASIFAGKIGAGGGVIDQRGAWRHAGQKSTFSLAGGNVGLISN